MASLFYNSELPDLRLPMTKSQSSGFQLDSSFQPASSFSLSDLLFKSLYEYYAQSNQRLYKALDSQMTPQQTFNLQSESVVPFSLTPDTPTQFLLSDLSLSSDVLTKAGVQPEQAGQIATSITQAAGNAGKVSDAILKYYNRMNTANKIAAGTDVLSGVSGLVDAYQGRDAVRLTNKQLDVQKTLIDTNIANREAVSNEQFRNSIADLQVLTAAKNVDIRSQAVRSDVVQGGEDLGEDMAMARVQGSLQKKAINFQKAMNKAQQYANEKQAWINLGANLMKSATYFI